jgi:hypothetical protein
MSFSLKTLCSNLIPVGKYKAQVTDMKFAAGGSKSILVTLTIAEGPYAKRVHIETIPEKAYSFRLMPVLKACKVDVDREVATAEQMMKFAFAGCKGKTIVIDMRIRTYNGQDYNNVTDFSPLPDSTVSVEDVAASFGETPEVKGSSLDGMVEEEINIPDNTPAADEPELDINLDDIESPF